MNKLNIYINFKNYIEKRYGLFLPSDIVDVYELLYFIREMLQKNYLINIREIFKLYDVKFTNGQYRSVAPVLLKFIADIQHF